MDQKNHFSLFFQPGAPCIYYGTEIGLSGGEEPACRECFPWHEYWNLDLRSFLRTLVDLRERLPELREGNFCWEPIGENGLHAYLPPQACNSSQI